MGSTGTGISAEQVILISGVVTTITQVLKASGLKGSFALLACALLSAAAVTLFGYSNVGFMREVVWSYFATWAGVFSSAAGVFGIINAAPDAALNIGRGVSTMKDMVTRHGPGDGKE